jgi:hypothetical protein
MLAIKEIIDRIREVVGTLGEHRLLGAGPARSVMLPFS